MKKHRDLGVTLIAIGKLLKVTILVTAGVLMLSMSGQKPTEALHRWAVDVGISPSSRHVHRLMEKLAGMSHGKLQAVSLATFVYAAVFAVEGVGLWLQERWAEYLSIVVTGSFVPFEIYEATREPHAVRIVGLVLNVAAVVYLVVRVRRDRRKEKQDAERTANGQEGA